jgi:succinate dehydrogenase/fumarate reductase-like Fe-S protein
VIKAYRFLLDSRDALGIGRLYQLTALGLHRCQEPDDCSVRCPKDISLGEDVMKPLQEKPKK